MNRLTNEDLEEFIAAFKLFDPNSTGFIKTEDLINVMISMGQTPTENELDDIIGEIDEDEEGVLSIEDTIDYFQRKILSEEGPDHLIEAFKVFDVDGKGYIPLNELKSILKPVITQFGVQDVDEIITHFIGDDNSVKYDLLARLLIGEDDIIEKIQKQEENQQALNNLAELHRPRR